MCAHDQPMTGSATRSDPQRGIPMLFQPLTTVRRTSGAAGLAALVLTSAANAQWSATSLHPFGATDSQAFGVDGSQVVGSAFYGSIPIAAIWNDGLNAPIDLRPGGVFGAEVAAAGGGRQVGYIIVSGPPIPQRPRAVVWNGLPSTYVELTSPVGTAGTRAFGVGGGQQVGISLFGILSNPQSFASLWSGTAESFVNLHNASLMSASFAYATDGRQQVGAIIKPLNDPSPGNRRAALWTGSAESFVSLHPAGATDSEAVAVSLGQQVGNIFPANSNNIYASLWRGTAASWVNLNPPGATSSEATGVASGMQVGWAIFDDGTGMDTGNVYASAWAGTADSWLNLSTFLPAGYIAAEATGIWTDGLVIKISGFAINTNANDGNGRYEAILWTITRNGLADIGGANQSPWPDGQRTADDIIVYLGWFFAGDTRANIAGPDQSTVPDANLTADDIIVFLGRYFAP